ncbi:hypothetical protein [Thiolapillus sp.]
MSPGLPRIPNVQHAIVSDPGEPAPHWPVARRRVGFRSLNTVATPI